MTRFTASRPLQHQLRPRVLSLLLSVAFSQGTGVTDGAVAEHRTSSFLALAAERADSAQALTSGRSNKTQQSPTLYAPLPNDTVSPEYWAQIDAAIASASASTAAPSMNSGQVTTVTNHWTQVFSQSKNDFTANDLSASDIANAQQVSTVTTSYAPAEQAAAIHGLSNLAPYNMQVGARVMWELTADPTDSPVPSQETVSQQFVAQCPLIMWADQIEMSAPRCGNSMGIWSDPESDRTILRWAPHSGGSGTNDYGGVSFGVDSIITGNGSVTYATASQQFSLEGTSFELKNCLNVMRYTITEQVMSVEHIGAGVTSSIQAHDTSNTGQAYFYKYTILAPNGTAVAETSLYRSTQNQVTVTQVMNEVSSGSLIATATKKGTWSGEDWGSCDGAAHEWVVDFAISSRDVTLPATVMDLRVASAAMLTLMAYRSMSASESGVSRNGEHQMIFSILKALIFILLVLFCCLCGGIFVKRGNHDKNMRNCCFKFEAVCMPKKPLWERTSPFYATY